MPDAGHFRKKPVVVRAMQFTDFQSGLDILNWYTQSMVADGMALHLIPTVEVTGAYMTIPTAEGRMRASVNDWIIRGVNGEFYPCKPDIFEKTYEVAT